MINTSIQHIINANHLNQEDIKMLFTRKTYPLFELGQLKTHHELSKKEKFIFFVKILERWNNDVNDCEYVKNDFIYSWLKSLAVQNLKHIDVSLEQLYKWFSSSKFTPPVTLFQKETKKKIELEQWQIRNSYKSNLPLEIDSYKRRYIFQQKNLNEQSKLNIRPSTTTNTPTLSVHKHNSKLIDTIRRQNNFVKVSREDNQMKDFLSNYKKKKVQFYKDMVKNYYKSEFENNKIMIQPKLTQTAAKFYKTDHIKHYRIKTANQGRPFRQTVYNQSQSNLNNQKLFTKLSVKANDISFDDDIKFPIVNCDNLGLLTNPFDIKIKKKKK